jgi:hypothetical protein
MNFGLDKKSWWDGARILISLCIFLIYLYQGANFYGKFSRDQIMAQSPIQVRFSDNEIKKGILIGKTREVLFLLKDKKVDAVPITSLVKEFEIK